jgi:hypothetical protein
MKQRRVGTLTLGGVLILYGIVFLLHTFIKGISYYLIFQMWPVIFIALGIEVLFSSICWKEQEFKYDFGAIPIICILAVFAMGMAGMDWIYNHAPQVFDFSLV